MIPAGKPYGKMMLIQDNSGNMTYTIPFDVINGDNHMWDGLTPPKEDIKPSGGSYMISCYLGGCAIFGNGSNTEDSTSDEGGSVKVTMTPDDGDLPYDGDLPQATPVPLPAAAWLFMSGLIGLVWKGRKTRQSAAQ